MPETDHQTDLILRVVPMPSDVNAAGDIFGGYVLSQMDIAGGLVAGERARGRVVTVAIDAMKFIRPVRVGDILCIYGNVARVGTTSVSVSLEAWALRHGTGERRKVTEGLFVYVALDGEGKKRNVDS